MTRCDGRRNCRRAKNTPEINLTPLIDTALTLVVILILSTTGSAVNNGVKIDLPTGRSQETTESPREIVVEIDKQGKLFFNGITYILADLMQALKLTVGNKKDCTVFVRGDQGAPYGTIMNVVDEIKFIGGVQDVALDTRRSA